MRGATGIKYGRVTLNAAGGGNVYTTAIIPPRILPGSAESYTDRLDAGYLGPLPDALLFWLYIEGTKTNKRLVITLLDHAPEVLGVSPSPTGVLSSNINLEYGWTQQLYAREADLQYAFSSYGAGFYLIIENIGSAAATFRYGVEGYYKDNWMHIVPPYIEHFFDVGALAATTTSAYRIFCMPNFRRIEGFARGSNAWEMRLQSYSAPPLLGVPTERALTEVIATGTAGNEIAFSQVLRSASWGLSMRNTSATPSTSNAVQLRIVRDP